MWLTLLFPFKSYIIDFICFHASNAFCNQSHTWNALKLHVKFANPIQLDRPTFMDSMSWIVSASLNRNTSTATMSIMATYLHHQQHKMHVSSMAVGHHRGMHLCLLCLSARLPTGYCVGWLVCPHKLPSRVSLRLGPFCVCRKYYPPACPRIDRTPAGDASGQESTLLTVPSNAPYITYTDADGQVYRRRRRISLPR